MACISINKINYNFIIQEYIIINESPRSKCWRIVRELVVDSKNLKASNEHKSIEIPKVPKSNVGQSKSTIENDEFKQEKSGIHWCWIVIF